VTQCGGHLSGESEALSRLSAMVGLPCLFEKRCASGRGGKSEQTSTSAAGKGQRLDLGSAYRTDRTVARLVRTGIGKSDRV